MTLPVALLVSPAAAQRRDGRLLADVTTRLSAAAPVLRVSGDDAASAAASARAMVADGVSAVVALGGDGTMTLALDAVAGTDTPLAVVPAGTGNDLAAALGLPRRDPLAAADLVADRLRSGQSRPMDAVRAGGTWFATVMCSGFDSRVSDRVNRLSWPRGQARYLLAVLAELRVFRPVSFELSLDDEAPRRLEAMMIAVGNTRSYGAGMRICPAADPWDGLLDVTIVGPVSTGELVRTFPKVFRGTHTSHPAVTTLRARRVRLAATDVTAYADGEPLQALPLSVECVPGAVRMLL